MSGNQTVPTQFRLEFMDGLITKFQHQGFQLKGFTSAPSKVNADKVQWDTLGPMEPSKKVRGSDAILANPDHAKVEATMEEWELYFLIEEYDLMRMPHNLKEKYKLQAAKGLGGRFDKNILIELNTGANKAIGSQDFGDGTTPVTLAQIAQGHATYADEYEWPDGAHPVCCVSKQTFTSFQKYPQWNNSQYVGPELPLIGGTRMQARTWNGIHFISLSRKYFPSNAANTHDFFMWLPEAVGYAHAFDGISDLWNLLVRRRAWECNMMFSGKTKVLLPEGVIRFRNPNVVPLTF